VYPETFRTTAHTLYGTSITFDRAHASLLTKESSAYQHPALLTSIDACDPRPSILLPNSEWRQLPVPLPNDASILRFATRITMMNRISETKTDHNKIAGTEKASRFFLSMRSRRVVDLAVAACDLGGFHDPIISMLRLGSTNTSGAALVPC
jgi:hypothetical protein